MLIALDPKSQFLKLEIAEKFRQITSGEVLSVACSYAMAHFAMTGISQEQLEGAKKFLNVLLNLGERPEPSSSYPQKALQHPERLTKKDNNASRTSTGTV